jgi:hypothetical protein
MDCRVKPGNDERKSSRDTSAQSKRIAISKLRAAAAVPQSRSSHLRRFHSLQKS